MSYTSEDENHYRIRMERDFGTEDPTYNYIAMGINENSLMIGE